MKTFKVIDCENYIYITETNSLWSSSLSNYLFDGKQAEKTNKNNWFKLEKIPTEILQKKPNQKVNIRYELKAGYTPTELLPQIITKEMYESEDYDEVIGLYTYKYDEEDSGYETVEFKIDNIYKRENFEFIPNTYNAEVSLLTQIEYPEELYQEKPCQLSSEQVYKLIRERVKKDINTKVATIKSDYDFHFEVVKRLDLCEPYSVQKDINNSSRRKPKWVTNMISEKQVPILNLKRKPSDHDYGKDCKLAPVISGENYEDLNNKVEKYLDELMSEINIKYNECPHCKGWGVVEVKNE